MSSYSTDYKRHFSFQEQNHSVALRLIDVGATTVARLIRGNWTREY